MSVRYVVDRMRNLAASLNRISTWNPTAHWAGTHQRSVQGTGGIARCARQESISGSISSWRYFGKRPREQSGHEARAKILQAALEQAPRVGEYFACDMLDRAVRPTLSGHPTRRIRETLEEPSHLSAEGAVHGGHFDRAEYVQPSSCASRPMLQPHSTRVHSLTIETVDNSGGAVVPELAQARNAHEIEQLLRQMADLVLKGKHIEVLVRSFDAKKDSLAPLIALLHVAGSWYYFGRDHLAEPVFKAARVLLFRRRADAGKATPRSGLHLCGAVGQATPAIASGPAGGNLHAS